MRAIDALATLEELGSAQWGLVTTAQSEAFGVSRVTLGRLRDDEIIHPVRRGVWSLPSADLGPFQELRAAWLSTRSKILAADRRGTDADTAVSHVSAAAIHSLGDLIPARHEFTASRRRQTTQGDLRFHRTSLEDDVVMVDGLPVTSIPRTVQDLAARIADLDHFAAIVCGSLSSATVRLPELEGRLDGAARRFGLGSGSALVEECLDRAGLSADPLNLAGTKALTGVLAERSSSSLKP